MYTNFTFCLSFRELRPRPPIPGLCPWTQLGTCVPRLPDSAPFWKLSGSNPGVLPLSWNPGYAYDLRRLLSMIRHSCDEKNVIERDACSWSLVSPIFFWVRHWPCIAENCRSIVNLLISYCWLMLLDGVVWSCCTSRASAEKWCTGTAIWRLTEYIRPFFRRRQFHNMTTTSWPMPTASPASFAQKSDSNMQVSDGSNVDNNHL